MIAIPALLAIFAACVLLERFVKSATVRVIGVLILVIVSAGIAINVGIHLGKVEQLNRFARLLPRAFATLDQHKQQPETLGKAISLLQDVANDPAKLGHIESTIDELEELQVQRSGK